MEYSSGEIMEYVINKTWITIETPLHEFKEGKEYESEYKIGSNWQKDNGLFKPKIIIPSVRG